RLMYPPHQMPKLIKRLPERDGLARLLELHECGQALQIPIHADGKTLLAFAQHRLLIDLSVDSLTRERLNLGDQVGPHGMYWPARAVAVGGPHAQGIMFTG